MKITQVIALDGPVASGKSTVGRLVARKLGYRFLDTGAMYRAFALLSLQTGMDTKDKARLVDLAHQHTMDVALQEDGSTHILVDGQDVTSLLRDPKVEERVSQVSMVPGVREVMVSLQRRVAEDGSIVLAGRDIGTVVLPEAPLKVFLTASASERAQRRFKELQALGQDVTYEKVLQEMTERDKMDSERKVAPLRPSPDARVIVTDNCSAEEVVNLIISLARARR